MSHETYKHSKGNFKITVPLCYFLWLIINLFLYYKASDLTTQESVYSMYPLNYGKNPGIWSYDFPEFFLFCFILPVIMIALHEYIIRIEGKSMRKFLLVFFCASVVSLFGIEILSFFPYTNTIMIVISLFRVILQFSTGLIALWCFVDKIKHIMQLY